MSSAFHALGGGSHRLTKGGRFLGAASLIVLLSGCDPQLRAGPPSVELPPGQNKLVPTSYVKVGRIYRQGRGEHPYLLLNGKDVYSEICWDDFLETNALANISTKYVVAGDLVSPEAKSSLSFDVGATYSVDVLGKAGTVGGGVNPSSEYTLTNVRQVFLTEAGSKLIREKIADGCKAEIRKNLKAGRKVFITAEGLRADSGKQTSGVKVNLDPKIGPVGISGKVDRSGSATMNNVLISVRLQDL